MASRRMISTSLGDSEKFARLKNDTHRLAYVLLVTWADAEGRYLADSVSLRGKLYTRLPWSADQVEAALLDMHEVGLIRLYTSGKHRYGVIVGFHVFNTIRRDTDGKPKEEAPSRLPEPPEEVTKDTGTGAAPEQHPSSTGPTWAEVEVEVEVEPQKEQDLKPSSTSLTRATDYPSFLHAWNYHRAALPAARSLDAKRRRLIDALRKEHGDNALPLFTAATQCVAADDYWIQQGYGLDNLLRTGRVLEKAEKFHANAGMTAGDRKLATTAATIARAIGGIDA